MYIEGNEAYAGGGWSQDEIRLAHRRVVAFFAYEGIDEHCIRQYVHFDISSDDIRNYTFVGTDAIGHKTQLFITDTAGYYSMMEFILECDINITCNFQGRISNLSSRKSQPIIAEWLNN